MKKIFLLVIIGITVIFIITNPSITDFKSYLGKNSYKGLRRKANLFVYSIYQDSSYDYNRDIQFNKKYIGLFGNFFEMNKSPALNKKPDIETDSSKNDPFKEFGGKRISKSTDGVDVKSPK